MKNLTYLILSLMFFNSAFAAEPAPKPSPKPKTLKPFYLPLDEIITKEKQKKHDEQKKKLQTLEKANYGQNRVVDLSKYDTGIISQYRGDCTAQGMANAMESLLRRKDPQADVSQESFWAWYRIPSIDSAVEAAQAHWIKREAAWPFGAKTWKLPEEKGIYKVASVEYLGDDSTPGIGLKIIKSLDAGFPIYWGGSVSQDMASCFIHIRAGIPHTSGGHSVAMIGYQVLNNALWIKLKQTWGKTCGENGYQWLNLDSCAQGYCEFYSIKQVDTRP